MIVSGKKFREQVTAFVDHQQEPGELTRVIVPWVQTGPVWLSYSTTSIYQRYSLWPLLFRVRYYSLALTDRRVLLVRRQRRNAQPVEVEWSLAPQFVNVSEYRRTRRSRVIVLSASGMDFRLAVRPLFFDDADLFVNAVAPAR